VLKIDARRNKPLGLGGHPWSPSRKLKATEPRWWNGQQTMFELRAGRRSITRSTCTAGTLKKPWNWPTRLDQAVVNRLDRFRSSTATARARPDAVRRMLASHPMWRTIVLVSRRKGTACTW